MSPEQMRDANVLPNVLLLSPESTGDANAQELSPELTGDADARLPAALIKNAEAGVMPVFRNAAVAASPEEMVAFLEPTAVVS